MKTFPRPHEQLTFVIEGQFEFTVGDESTILEPGTAALIPANVLHGGRTITACRVIDVFSPSSCRAPSFPRSLR